MIARFISFGEESLEQEIDLRPYVEAVLSKWYWILGLGLLAGILADGASLLLLSPICEATTLVSVTDPRQRVQVDRELSQLKKINRLEHIRK